MVQKKPGYVLITGASTGIGKACAEYLAKSGYHIFAGVRNAEDEAKISKEMPGNVSPVRLDVTDRITIQAAVDQISQITVEDGLVGLINNAGIAVHGPLELIPIFKFREQLEINTIGQLAVIQAFLPLLRKSKHPTTIINMSSKSGRVAAPFSGAYASSKFALEALNDALRLELKPWGIRVVCVEPGNIATPLRQKTYNLVMAFLDDAPEDILKPYRPVLESAKNTFDPDLGVHVMEVAKTVENILKSKQPKARYLIGKDAFTRILLSWLPTGLRDWLVFRKMPSYDLDGQQV